jgi:hypothetical protein
MTPSSGVGVLYNPPPFVPEWGQNLWMWSAVCTHGFCICKFNQMQIENIWGEIASVLSMHRLFSHLKSLNIRCTQYRLCRQWGCKVCRSIWRDLNIWGFGDNYNGTSLWLNSDVISLVWLCYLHCIAKLAHVIKSLITDFELMGNSL